MPFFSVVIATRNRPALFHTALSSVLAQSYPDTEVIVVNDGSDAEHQRAYDAILDGSASARVRRVTLLERPRGHGGAYATNAGADAAKGKYLCFLDDDDCWTDPGHLARVRTMVEAMECAPDLVITDQAAFLNGEPRPGPIWIEDLPKILARSGKEPD
ncbi:MAG: glycosyltransferase family 2 protein, partial [Acetobacteraceae bacterium]